MKLKYLPLALFLMVLPLCATAQKKVVMFYDRDWNITNSEQKTTRFFRKTSSVNLHEKSFDGKVEDFYILGQKQMSGNYNQGKKNGEFIFYYPDGKLEKRGSYKDDQRDGKWKFWFPNGKIKQIIIYSKDNLSVIEAYNFKGKQTLKNGNGTWYAPIYQDRKQIGGLAATFKNGKRHGTWKYFSANNGYTKPLFTEKYKEGIFKKAKSGLIRPNVQYKKLELGNKFKNTEGFTINQRIKSQNESIKVYNEDYFIKNPDIRLGLHLVPTDIDDKKIYRTASDATQPIGGLRNMYRYIGNTLMYPSTARRKGIQGKVYISFIVEKDGSLTNFKVEKGIGGGCDAEALRVCKGLPKFIPAVINGKRVRTRQSIPITFKLM